MRRTLIISALGAFSLAAVVAGCSGSAASPAAPSAPAASSARATSVDVGLQEWAVVPASTSVAAGTVTFNAKNTGPTEVHEMVVVKTDLAPGALPVNADGSINEDGAGITAIGEVEDVAVGSSAALTVDLEPGKYVLLCNIVDGSDVHFQKGMRTAFEVTP